MDTQRFKNLPPELALVEILESIIERSDMRFTDSPAANARLKTIHKRAETALLIFRSMVDTNSFDPNLLKQFR